MLRAVRIPEGIDPSTAPIIEPIIAVLRSILWSPPKPGSKVAIIGGGPCGLIAGQIIRNKFAADKILIVKNSPYRAGVCKNDFADGAVAIK